MLQFFHFSYLLFLSLFLYFNELVNVPLMLCIVLISYGIHRNFIYIHLLIDHILILIRLDLSLAFIHVINVIELLDFIGLIIVLIQLILGFLNMEVQNDAIWITLIQFNNYLSCLSIMWWIEFMVDWNIWLLSFF